MDKKIKRVHVKQLEQRDCGVACLLSILRYYGGDANLQTLREWSGTDRQGSTLMGLKEGANKFGIEMDGYEVDGPADLEIDGPAILHVQIQENFEHYVVLYEIKDGKYLVGNPDAPEPEWITEERLLEIWKSKALLYGKPTKNFVKKVEEVKEKFRWVWDLIKPDLNILLLALGIGLVMSIIGLASAVFNQVFIDRILPQKDESLLIIALFAFGFITVFSAMIAYVRSIFLIRQSRDFNNRIINKFYGLLMRLPKMFFDSRKTGEMIARMNDTAQIQSTVNTVFNTVMIHILTAIAAAIGIFVYSPLFGMLALISIPLFTTLAYFFNPIIVKWQRRMMQAHAMKESNYVDTIQGIAPIKEGNREGVFSRLTKQIYGMYQQTNYEAGKVGLNIGLFSGILTAFLTMTIMSLGMMKVMHDEMELGQLMAVMQMALSMLIPSVGSLAGIIVPLQAARVAFDRMYEFVGIDPEYDEVEAKTKEPIGEFRELKVQNLEFRFIGRPRLLKDISLEVNKGEVIALLGESGCGKSTFMQILQKFYHPVGGQITVNGREWEDISTADWRSKIATVPQEIKLFNANLLSNIALEGLTQEESAKIDPDAMEKWLTQIVYFCEQWGFDKYFNSWAQGYMTVLGEEGVNISGGQRQLVALARALYQKPELLLLDEATSAMDRETEADILGKLQDRKNEFGVILVTHRIKTASKADRIYVIENGVISAGGSHEDLMKTDNFYSLSVKDLLQGL